MLRRAWCLMVGLVAAVAVGRSADLSRSRGAYNVVADALASSAATQAAAADESHVYAIASSEIVKYDRASGKELARSKGPAQHLNSGFLLAGRLYCAHSNYPRQPHQSDIRVLDPDTMALTIFHSFLDPPGSLTWAVRRGTHWWCHFAHYGSDNAKSVLVQYDPEWRERGRWRYPPELIAEWGSYSLSGGLWHGADILATGHDRKLIYRLRLPQAGKVIDAIEAIPSPFPGQGIAADPKTGGLVGIDRSRKQVVFATFDAAR